MRNIPLVTQQLDFRVVFALDPVVTFPREPHFVLPLEKQLLKDTSTK